MNIILDAIIFLLAVVFIVDGFKRGAVRSILDIVGFIIVLLVASSLSTFLADIIFNSFVRESMLNQINQSLSNSVGQDAGVRIHEVFNSLPSFISNTIKFYGVSEETLASSVPFSSANAAEEIIKSIAPVIIRLIKTVVFAVLFAILISLFKVFSRTLNRLFKIPVLKQVNELLGVVCGTLKCAILVFIICWLIRIFIPMLDNSPKIFSQENIDATILFKNIYYNNPLYTLLWNFKV